jgi:hypothetical protein
MGDDGGEVDGSQEVRADRTSTLTAPRSVDDPVRTSAEKYLSLTVAPPSND